MTGCSVGNTPAGNTKLFNIADSMLVCVKIAQHFTLGALQLQIASTGMKILTILIPVKNAVILRLSKGCAVFHLGPRDRGPKSAAEVGA